MRLPKRLLRSSIAAALVVVVLLQSNNNNVVSGTMKEEIVVPPIVKDCTPRSVTIDVDNGVVGVAPGQILAYVGSSNPEDDDISSVVCGHCQTLFRKIVAQVEEEGEEDHPNRATFITEYASFADVFPIGEYDDSLADAKIEPMLACDNSSNNKEGYYEEEENEEQQQPSNQEVVVEEQPPPFFNMLPALDDDDKDKWRRFLQGTTDSPSQAPSFMPSTISTSSFSSSVGTEAPTPDSTEEITDDETDVDTVPDFLTSTCNSFLSLLGIIGIAVGVLCFPCGVGVICFVLGFVLFALTSFGGPGSPELCPT